jgi:hypothetical protein
MDLEDPNGVSEGDIGLPAHLPSFKGDTIGSVSFSDWICL